MPTRARGLDDDVRPIAVVVIVGAIMSILDTTIVNVALQTLREDLDVSLATIQWVSTGYLLALSAVIPLTGWMAERFGARRVWMGSVAAFVAASVLCGAAWSAESLVAFRVLQGLAGGMIMPIGMITLAQAAGPKRMGRVMSVVGVPMLMGPVIGPVLGGLIVDNLSWRWIFYVNVPIGVVGLVLAYRLLPAGRAAGRAAVGVAPVLDRVGLLLLSPGVAAIVYGLSQVGEHGTLATSVAWLPLVVGSIAVVAFVLRALRIDFPLVEVPLFRGAGFSAAAATVFLLGAALFGSMILLPLYYQVVRGDSPLQAGLLMTPQGIGAAIGMNVGGRLTDRFGGGRVVPVGLLILAVGTIPYALIGGSTSYVLLMAGLFVRGVGLGASMMPAMAAAYATLESGAEVPRATPMLNVIQRVGGSLGVAILTVVLQRAIVSELHGGAAAGAAGASGSGTLPAGARERLADPLGAAFANAYLWSLVGIAIALIPALLLMREERRARGIASVGGPPGGAGEGEESPPAAVAAG